MAGDGVLVVAVILAMVGLSDGIGWEVVISLTGGFLHIERSNFLAFCFSYGTGIGMSSFYRALAMIWVFEAWGCPCVLEMLDGMETNKFAVAEEVEGHVVVAITGSDMVGGVAFVVVTAVIHIEVVNALDSTRDFSINLTLYCALPVC